jgi:hypothetical protein
MLANGNIGLNFNQNPGQGSRISTRVLAPPGGSSSISFGGGGYSAPMPQRNRPPVQSSPKKNGGYGSGYVGTIGSSADDMNYKKFKNQFDDCLSKPEINRSPRLQNRRMKDSLDTEMDLGKLMPSPLRYGNAHSRHEEAPQRRGGRNEYPPRGYDDQPSRVTALNGPMGKEAYAEILRQQIMSNKGMDTGSKIGRKQEQALNNNPYSHKDHRRAPQQSIVGGRRGTQPSAAKTSFSLGWD